MRIHICILVFAAFATASALEPPALITGGLTNIAGASDSLIEAITPDGRWAVFVSHANNLVTNDDLQPYSDIFVRDLQAGRTSLVTVSTNGNGGGNGNSHFASISPDGLYVIFASEASNLIQNDTNGVSDIFRRDLQTSTTELVSIARTGGVAARSVNRSTTGASKPFVTPNARWVAFESTSTEFVDGDTNQTGKIFVRDLQTGVTRLATAGARHSRFGSLTDNGRYLAFVAEAAESMPGRTNTGGDVFVADLQTSQQFWASTNLPSPIVSWYRSGDPIVTPDGRMVFFKAVSSSTYFLQHDLTTGETILITESDYHTVIGRPLVTADGQTEFFETNVVLVANDNNGAHDVFRRDRQSGVTELVSALHPLRPSRSAMRSVTFDRDTVDATAARIAFVSPDIPGIPGDTNAFYDIFVRDLATGALHTFPTQHDYWATNFSLGMKAVAPQISADGVALIFVRQRFTNEVPAGSDLLWHVIGGEPPLVVTNICGETPAAITPNGQMIVYQERSKQFYTWHDLATGIKRSVPGPSPESKNPDIYEAQRPVFSNDGRWLAYRTSDGGVAVYSVESNSVVLLQRTSDGGFVSYNRGGDLALSADSRFLFFEGSSARQIYRHDLLNRRTDLICTNCVNPSTSGDGNLVAYNFSVTSVPGDVVIHDLRTGAPQSITREFIPTNAFSRLFSAPSISADGRYVVFSTTLTNALAGDFNSRSDVYVYDRIQRRTLLITRSRFGEGPATGSSSNPLLARDGRSVVFQSFANDLVDGDYNFERDIFVVKLGAGDSDNDGMDDDWEVAHFGDLSRDGAGDQDNDGQTDLQEFVAGTDPTSDNSILRVLTITPMSGGNTTVVWSAVVGRNYVVQYKDSLNASWSNASLVIEADSTSMSFTHDSSSPQRYYRVLAVQ